MITTYYYRRININNDHFDQIYDNSYFIKKKINKKFLNFNIPKLKFLKKLKVLNPSKRFKIYWDILNLLLTFFQFFIISIDLTFNISIVSLYFSFINPIFILFFTFDILINLNTAIFLNGRLMIERNVILKNYFKNGILFDILTCLCIFQLFPRTIFDLIFFIRIFKFRKIIKNLKIYLLADQKIQNIMNLFSLFFNIFLVSHIFACMWILIGKQNRDNWIQKNNLENSPWYEQYLYSYYFVVITMNTVGYGFNL